MTRVKKRSRETLSVCTQFTQTVSMKAENCTRMMLLQHEKDISGRHSEVAVSEGGQVR